MGRGCIAGPVCAGVVVFNDQKLTESDLATYIDSKKIPEENSNIKGELYDLFGQIKSKIIFNRNQATFSVKGLSTGIYVLKLFINDVAENHQIAVE